MNIINLDSNEREACNTTNDRPCNKFYLRRKPSRNGNVLETMLSYQDPQHLVERRNKISLMEISWLTQMEERMIMNPFWAETLKVWKMDKKVLWKEKIEAMS